MSGFQNLRYSLEGGVAKVTLDRPERLNALTTDLLAELGGALDRAVAEGARAVLLTGEGRSFSSGADLADGLPDDLGLLLAHHYNPLAEKLAALAIPVVTAVNGPAAGAGCSLALMGDLVIAARSAYFLLAFVNIGLVPDAGATWLVARAVGRAKALEMMLLGERISAAKAEEWGLIHRAVDDADLEQEACALASRLANGPTRAMGMIRLAIGEALTGTLSETLSTESANQSDAGRTADFREGVAAFLGKRPAIFEGK